MSHYLNHRSVRLELANVRKSFGTTIALSATTLLVEPGSLMALLGPSGCGKTTTLRVIAGFETPDSGAVLLNGEDVTGLPSFRRGLGMVFQNYSLFPHMTIFENVAFGLKMAGVSANESRRRVGDILDLVRLPGMDTRFPHQLSGGQQQRVALARALVTQPKVLLLDEPLGALDKNLRERMQFELRRLQQELGITSILVTHDQEEALTVSDKIAVMNQGKILQIGTPTEVYDRPRTRFVSEFLGTSNVFNCRVLDRNSKNGCRIGLIGFDEAANFALPAPGTADGKTEVLFAIRPEQMRLNLEKPGGDAVSISGQVQDRVFRGTHHAYQVRLAARPEPLFVNQQASGVMAGPLFEAGQNVFVSWHPENGVLLHDD